MRSDGLLDTRSTVFTPKMGAAAVLSQEPASLPGTLQPPRTFPAHQHSTGLLSYNRMGWERVRQRFILQLFHFGTWASQCTDVKHSTASLMWAVQVTNLRTQASHTEKTCRTWEFLFLCSSLGRSCDKWRLKLAHHRLLAVCLPDVSAQLQPTLFFLCAL